MQIRNKQPSFKTFSFLYIINPSALGPDPLFVDDSLNLLQTEPDMNEEFQPTLREGKQNKMKLRERVQDGPQRIQKKVLCSFVLSPFLLFLAHSH
ncbi:hypothetical protein TNCV_4124461 [Trichonephila clavipes]|nr:hypothetical protein TNCV_4124461 [Trichonephila clavipes]